VAFPQFSGVATDYSSSALRFGLVDIKPIEVVETVKRFGIKFLRTTRTFESLQASQSYADFVTLQNEAIFSTIDIPERFDAEKLVTMLSQMRVKRYEEDTELQKAIKELRNAKTIEGPLLKYTHFIIDRFESKREEYVEVEAARFLTSNLPLSFYSKFVVFDNTYYRFLKVLEQIVRMSEFRARTARSFPMHSRHIEAMKKSLSPIIDQMDATFFTVSRLKKYITIWNAKDYREIEEEPKFLDINKVDYKKFEQLSNDFKGRLAETRKFLLGYEPHIIQKEPHLENEPTARMFGKLAMLPSSSLTVER
jgi:hypothetical protein